MIAAVAENNVIGKDNDLVWNLPDDMKFFMRKTTGHHVIMGRKNFESIPEKFRPLPNRTNIIVTRNQTYDGGDALIVGSIQEALEIAKKNEETEAFIIGGGQIYEMGLPLSDIMYITEIKASFTGDTFYPVYPSSEWKERERIPHEVDERHAYPFDFVTYDRTSYK
ncbi:dihydrofolate reductase [Fulvivirga sp. M361]|nr:dihydrofolate reductase [Fulvivirga sp. M361]